MHRHMFVHTHISVGRREAPFIHFVYIYASPVVGIVAWLSIYRSSNLCVVRFGDCVVEPRSANHCFLPHTSLENNLHQGCLWGFVMCVRTARFVASWRTSHRCSLLAAPDAQHSIDMILWVAHQISFVGPHKILACYVARIYPFDFYFRNILSFGISK